MTPFARFARWFVLNRGMKCEACGERLANRGQRFCSDEHAEQWAAATAI